MEGEDDDDDEILLSDFDCEVTQKDPGSLARAARSKARHIASANQLLPWAYDGLAGEEIINLLLQLNRELKATREQVPSASPPERRLKQEVFCLLFIMLWTGSDIARAASIKIGSSPVTSADAHLRVIISDRPSVRWQIPALTPDYKTATRIQTIL
jgi:hypothetical protein